LSAYDRSSVAVESHLILFPSMVAQHGRLEILSLS
jgi:hypothetical protein